MAFPGTAKGWMTKAWRSSTARAATATRTATFARSGPAAPAPLVVMRGAGAASRSASPSSPAADGQIAAATWPRPLADSRAPAIRPAAAVPSDRGRSG